MPVSTSVHISHCLSLILQLSPRSVLDVGCGFGLWGFLCREYLDVFNRRVQPGEWEVRIDGLEVFEPYIQAHQRALYDAIIVEDLRTAAEHLDGYDLIIAGDVIEHMDKDDAERVLDALYAKAGRALLVNIPLGTGWDHPEEHGNPAELHRSQWSPEDFLPYPSLQQQFHLPCGAYGVFYCPKDASEEARFEGLLQTADRRAEEGRPDVAAMYLHRARALRPGDEAAALLLADVSLRARRPQEAVEALRSFNAAQPGPHSGWIMLAKVLGAVGDAVMARSTLAEFLARNDLPADLRDEAQRLLANLPAN